MDFKEFKDKYFTPENLAAYKESPDKMVFVSDLTWRSIDHSFVERLDLLFWYAIQDEKAEAALANTKPKFITIETVDAKLYRLGDNRNQVFPAVYLDKRVECGPKGGKMTLWRRADRRNSGKWYDTQWQAVYAIQ